MSRFLQNKRLPCYIDKPVSVSERERLGDAHGIGNGSCRAIWLFFTLVLEQLRKQEVILAVIALLRSLDTLKRLLLGFVPYPPKKA